MMETNDLAELSSWYQAKQSDPEGQAECSPAFQRGVDGRR